MHLFKTTIVIWSQFDPEDMLAVEHGLEPLEALARDVCAGDAYCAKMASEFVDPEEDDDWDGTEFFEGW